MAQKEVHSYFYHYFKYTAYCLGYKICIRKQIKYQILPKYKQLTIIITINIIYYRPMRFVL